MDDQCPQGLLLAEVRNALVVAATCWHGKAVDFLLTQDPKFLDAKLEIDKVTLVNVTLAVHNDFNCDDGCRQHYASTGISFLPNLEQILKSRVCADSRAF